jgi:two-component system NarL family sensor kinase
MKLYQKIQLLSVVVLMVAILVVALMAEIQFKKLSTQTVSSFRNSITENRKQALKNYVDLALSSIDHIYSYRNQDEGAAKELIVDILSDLEFGEDGYFFAYTNTGISIVHPKQTFRLGKNWWDLTDEAGHYIIRDLIVNAENGGGFVEYLWEKPSSKEVAQKLAYSVMLDRWQWMLGTGIYIDDIDEDVAVIQNEIDQKIRSSYYVILLIAFIALAIIFAFGIFLQNNERRLADEKLRKMNKRILVTQDEERRRISRELHDGISQLIASIKFSLETASQKIKENKDPDEDITVARERIGQTLQDLRRISRDLHPSVLDDHGLSVGIQSLAKSFSERTGIEVDFHEISVRNLLPMDVKTTLYRVAQEALTNIERHANASHIGISIAIAGDWVVLSIKDNGNGFDVYSLERNQSPTQGIGIRNMHERLNYHKGVVSITSSDQGTLVSVKIPKSMLRYGAT